MLPWCNFLAAISPRSTRWSIDEIRTEQLVAGQGLLPLKHGLFGNIRRTGIGTSFLRDRGCLPLEYTASNRLFGPVRRCVRFEHWYLDTERSSGMADDITRAQCPDGRARPDALRASRLFTYYPCRRSGRSYRQAATSALRPRLDVCGRCLGGL